MKSAVAARPNACHHSFLGGSSTMRQTASVTPAIVSGAVTASAWCPLRVAMAALRASLRLLRLQLGVGIANPGQIARSRPSVEVLEHLVSPLRRHQLPELTLRVVQIAEGDGAGRAYLLARRH